MVKSCEGDIIGDVIMAVIDQELDEAQVLPLHSSRGIKAIGSGEWQDVIYAPNKLGECCGGQLG